MKSSECAAARRMRLGAARQRVTATLTSAVVQQH
jgi:hypothetical protein